jgi:hypothetical protein
VELYAGALVLLPIPSPSVGMKKAIEERKEGINGVMTLPLG